MALPEAKTITLSFSETSRGERESTADLSRRGPFLAGFLHQGVDEGLADFDFGAFSNADDKAVILLVGDFAVDAAGRDDFIARGEGIEHLGMFLGLLALGSDHQEIHRREDENERQETHQTLRAGRRLLG
jgi:hypothetical protein